MFYRVLAVFAAVVLSSSAFAQDDGKITLQAGEQVTFLTDDGGRLGVSGGGAARLSPAEQAMVVQSLADNPGASGPNAALVDGGEYGLDAVERGVIRISLIGFAGEAGGEESRLLVIENGFGRALRYRAVIARGDRSMPTDVCTVLPGLRGYEHWPYPFDRIELSQVELIDWAQGRAPVCE